MTKPMSLKTLTAKLATVGTSAPITWYSVDTDNDGTPLYGLQYQGCLFMIKGDSKTGFVNGGIDTSAQTGEGDYTDAIGTAEKTFVEAVAAAVVYIDALIANTVTEQDKDKIMAAAKSWSKITYSGATARTVTLNFGSDIVVFLSKVQQGSKAAWVVKGLHNNGEQLTSDKYPTRIASAVIEALEVGEELTARVQRLNLEAAQQTAQEPAAEPQEPDHAIDSPSGETCDCSALHYCHEHAAEYFSPQEQKQIQRQSLIDNAILLFAGVGILILLSALYAGLVSPEILVGAALGFIPWYSPDADSIRAYAEDQKLDAHTDPIENCSCGIPERTACNPDRAEKWCMCQDADWDVCNPVA